MNVQPKRTFVRTVLACAVLAVSSAAFGQAAPPAVKLTGGVSENHLIEDADASRNEAANQRAKEVTTFLQNPRVYRVTKVDPVQKGSGVQHINAMPIQV